MVLQLVLTEKMVKYIYKGEFQQLLNEHQEFFKELSDNLKNVVFPKEHLSGQITTKLKFLLTFLEHPKSNDPECPVVHDAYWGWSFQKFFNHLKYGVVFHDWRSFYETYRPLADYMIREARMQEVIDFRIELGSCLYESFEARDLALAAQKQEAAQKLLSSRIPRLSKFFSRGKSHKPADIEAELTTETTEKLEHQLQEPLQIKKLILCDKTEQSKIEPGVPTNPQLDALEEILSLQLSNLKSELEKLFSHKLNEIYTTLEQHKENINSRISFNRNNILMKFNEFVTNVQKKQNEINASSVEKISKLEIKVQELLETHVEEMKLREEKLKVMEENLENKICEVHSKQELLNAKLEVVTEIQKQLQLQEHQIKSREGKLKLMKEKLEEKLNQIELREKYLDAKLGHVLELLKLNIDFQRVVIKQDTLAETEAETESSCFNNSDPVLNAEDPQSATDPIPMLSPSTLPISQANPESTPSDSLDDEAIQLSYDEEIQKMEDEFQKRLAEQKEANEIELRRVQEQGRERKKKNQEELRRRFGNLYTGAE